MANIIIKDGPRSSPQMHDRVITEGGPQILKNMSRAWRLAEKNHHRAQKDDRQHNGYTSPKKVLRRVASPPADAMRHFRETHDPRDTKALKAFIKKHQFNTVPGSSF